MKTKKLIEIYNLSLYLSIFLCISAYCFGASPAKIKTIYNSLDPSSLSQHLAFYELYPNTPEGQKALRDAWSLVAHAVPSVGNQVTPLPQWPNIIESLITLVNKPPEKQTQGLQSHELEEIEKIAQGLPHTKLKGHRAVSEDEVLVLTSEEIDLARGLLLSQLPPSPERLDLIRSYEASLDLMALQILTRISMQAEPKAKIRAINEFIFDEMGYRFPPHSLYAKDIDLYTFLPSVLDSRKGVCLGVSILYIALAQRLNLPIEMITPPGHIFVRYRNGDDIINIETTARGIHLDSEEYLGIETRSLQQRNVKEVIGLAHFNQASAFWQQKEYGKAIAAYEKAALYLPDDMLVKELMAYNLLFDGRKEEGEKLLKLVENYIPDYAIAKQNIAEDYLKGAVDAEGIKPLFFHVDETRESILKKKEALETTLKKYPRFRSGLFSLAAAWMQLHREKEALAILEKLHHVDPKDPSVEYYLASLYAERLDYNKAWSHLKQAEELVKAAGHEPRALQDFRKEMAMRCPE